MYFLWNASIILLVNYVCQESFVVQLMEIWPTIGLEKGMKRRVKKIFVHAAVF